MALLRFRVVTIVAAFCYLTIIDSAAITEEVAKKSERGFWEDAPEINLGVTENSANKTGNIICDKQPCAWAIYHPLTRRINSYITNVCKCSEQKPSCDQTDDDLSVGAYVYHCRPSTTVTESSEIPEEN